MPSLLPLPKTQNVVHSCWTHLEVCVSLEHCFLKCPPVEQNNGPQRYHSPISGYITLPGRGKEEKKDFADGNSSNALGLGDYPGLSKWVHCTHMKPSKWGAFSGWSQKGLAEGEGREFPSMGRFGCSIVGFGIWGAPYKYQREASRSLGWLPADSQQGNGGLSLKLRRKWMLPTVWMSWEQVPASTS